MIRHLRNCGAMLVCVFMLSACSPRNVSFRADVQPILKKYCLECHVPGGAGYNASSFDMSSYETVMKGGSFGPFVIPGDPFTSTLNMLVEGRADPSIQMPHGREKLGDREIEILKVWVQEGARDN
jgi:Planctomycete cytochrome C